MHWQDDPLAGLFRRDANKPVFQIYAFPAQIHHIAKPQARRCPEQDGTIPVTFRNFQGLETSSAVNGSRSARSSSRLRRGSTAETGFTAI